MQNLLEQNKAAVIRFNKEGIEQGNLDVFKEILSDDVINHSAPEGMTNGTGSFYYFLIDVLRKGFPDLKVEIFDQIAEGDKVTTRKVFSGTHTDECMGIPASGKKVAIQVIDIIRLHNGQYVEHWGLSNFGEVVSEISA